MFAVQFGHVNLVIMLVEGRSSKELLMEASDLEGYTALIIAIELGAAGELCCGWACAVNVHLLAVNTYDFDGHAGDNLACGYWT